MPIYEYRCKSCKKVFDELVRNSTQQISCPDCNSKDVEKLISAVLQIGGASKDVGSSSCSG